MSGQPIPAANPAFRGLWNLVGLLLIAVPVVAALIRWTADGWLALAIVGLMMLILTADWDES